MSIFKKLFNKKTSTDYLNDGIAEVNSKNLDAAIQDFTSAINLDSSNAMAYSNRGLCKIQKGAWENGLKDLKKAEALGLKQATDLLKQLDVEDRSKIKFVAPSEFNEIKSQSDKYSDELAYEFNYNEAVTAGLKGNDLEALDYYSKAIEVNPQFPEALYNRGNTYFRLGQYDKALIDFNNLIKLNPDFALAYHNRGVTKQYLGDNIGGCRDIKRAIELGDNVYAVNSYKQFCE